MLIEFSVANYLSFKDRVTLSMEAGNIKEYEEDNTFEAGKYRLLKSAAIYGANASGKSNLIKAIDFMKWFMQNSSKDTQSGETIKIEPFRLSTATENQPSFFEIILFIEGITYRYGFEITQEKVISEWLFEINKKEKFLFLREKGNIDVKSSFKEGKNLEDKTRNNALFLSVVAQFNGKIANKLLSNLRKNNIISGIQDLEYQGFTSSLLLRPQKEKILELIKYADLGIEDITLNKERYSISLMNLGSNDYQQLQKDGLNFMSNEVIIDKLINKDLKIRPETKHKKLDENNKPISDVYFDLEDEESEGTKKYFRLIGVIIEVIEEGENLIIDEIDAKLHPILTKQIIKLFNSKETNPKNAQLIFATHDTNLLSAGILRRDQIWFTEKNRQGATDLYSLLEFKFDDESKVRNDASFEKDYLKGRYGAIPYLGDFSKIFKPEN